MTFDQVLGLFGALTALLGAVAALLVQVRQLRVAVNGMLHELTEAKATAAEKEGELRGRDYATSQVLQTPPPEIREHV